jgi:hypothetical protein
MKKVSKKTLKSTAQNSSGWIGSMTSVAGKLEMMKCDILW